LVKLTARLDRTRAGAQVGAAMARQIASPGAGATMENKLVSIAGGFFVVALAFAACAGRLVSQEPAGAIPDEFAVQFNISGKLTPAGKLALRATPRTLLARAGPRAALLPHGVELSPVNRPARSATTLFIMPLPELGEVTIEYRPAGKGAPLLPAAVLPATELILGASDSMKGLLDGTPKFEIARQVVNELADALPADVQVGLRLYGHWGAWVLRRTDPTAGPVAATDPRLNTDSELVVPIGPLDPAQRASLKRWINWASPRGKTPMVYSLLEAQKDFSRDWRGPRTVVLVSDGMESCGGKLEDVSTAYRDSGTRAVIHVVGFNIQGTEAEKRLREIARIGGGDYFGLQNRRQLTDALRAAVAGGSFLVYDAGGNTVVARGRVNGPPVSLVPGQYKIGLAQVKSAPITVSLADCQILKLKLSDSGTIQTP
jgi:hypothetical protein